jgi:cytochrome c5
MICISLSCLFLGCLYGAAQTTAQTTAQPASAPTQKQQSKTSSKASQTMSNSSEGEKRFEANCGRCHTPPEDISPREARAIVRQMRVRAMLSAEDEQLILKYIAP